ncbi:hypothetical protein HY450_02245 [Candidatus Pacearchaeota archaeon]|nr:hypothetical protein [Candidatus Pacearchaeota archaeon]
MQDVRSVNNSKDRIIAGIRLRGPSLPVQIAKDVGVSLLFASAFLSELRAEGRIKISNMRVGSSPLYFLSGQEEKLENFFEYLNQREKEAFLLLKDKKILEDSEQTPIVRVALRSIKDFASPLRINIDGETRMFWKYFVLSDEESLDLLRKPIKEETLKSVSDEKEMRTEEEKQQEEIKPEKEKKKVVRKAVKKEESEFAKIVREYLTAKDIEILEVFSEKKREFEAKIRIDNLFGKQEYYLFARDKKNVSENDFVVASQKANGIKMPVLVVSPGEMNKKAKEHLSEWKNLVKFEKLRF